MKSIKFQNNRIVGDFLNPYIVAELNTSHFGDINIAKNMILKAKECGCDCVKLQSWSSESLYSKKFYDSNKMAKRFYDKFSLSSDEIITLLSFSQDISIDLTSTPYSIEEARFLARQDKIPFIKIASMEINNYKYLDQLGRLGKPLVLSTGMASSKEIENAIEVLNKTGNNDLIILHCVSIYPSKVEIINLNNIKGLRRKFSNYPIGFSDHTEGISIPTAATALGACLIEKHFTLDKGKIGLDNQMATEPEEMKNMVKSCREVNLSLGSLSREVIDEEIVQRDNMRRSLIASKFIKKGSTIKEEDIIMKRPGNGIPPNFLSDVIGSILVKDMEEEEQFAWENLKKNN